LEIGVSELTDDIKNGIIYDPVRRWLPWASQANYHCLLVSFKFSLSLFIS
jgi:hypothetical protein